MNWTGGRLRRHSQINSKARKQTFGNTSAASKGHGPHQITLFNSFAKQQDAEKRGNLKHSTGNPENRTVESLPQASSNTSTDAASRPPNRLERIKRRLLETADWAAVGVARPIQVAFTPEEEIERFGKRRKLTRDDHERLNKSVTMPGRPLRLVDEANALSDGGPDITPRNVFLPMGEADFTEANTNPYYPHGDPRRISSQPMLMEDESLDVNNGVGVQSSLPSTNGVARGAGNASSLSRSSSGLQRRGDRVIMTNLVQMNGEPYLSARQWLEQGHAMETSQSNRSSSIVPEPESTVRRRFTIDDQIRDAQALYRQRRPPASSPSRFAQPVGQGQIVSERPTRMFPGGPPMRIPPTLFRRVPRTNGHLDNRPRLSVSRQTLQQFSNFPPLSPGPRPSGSQQFSNFPPLSPGPRPSGSQQLSRFPSSSPSPLPLSSQQPGAAVRALTAGQGRLEGPVLGNANESLNGGMDGNTNGNMNGEAGSDEQSAGDNANDDLYLAYLNF